MAEKKIPTKEETVDFFFPKGDKRRGEALIIMASAYIEGFEDGRLAEKSGINPWPSRDSNKNERRLKNGTNENEGRNDTRHKRNKNN